MSPLDHELRFRVHASTYDTLKRVRSVMRANGHRGRHQAVSVSDVARALLVAYLEDPMGRLELPNRRTSFTVPVELTFGGSANSWDVTFGVVDGAVRECFCSAGEANKTGSDLQALLTDACIAVSLLLQRKETIHTVARAFGENRGEGQASGPPASLMGAVARAGAELEKTLSEGDGR